MICHLKFVIQYLSNIQVMLLLSFAGDGAEKIVDITVVSSRIINARLLPIVFHKRVNGTEYI